MRNLSAATLAKIAQKTGNEPINVVRIWWTASGYIDYADRTFGGIQGKLLTLSDVEDVINVSGNSSSTSVQVTLDDTDGSIKEIFNNTDIHRRRVQILQWFSDIPFGEAFPIFEGEIASPVKWSEGDVTLSFDVLSKLYDREVGFSAEEGEFNWIPPNLIGQAWPLIFGTVRGVPGLLVSEIPTGLTGESTGLSEENTNDKQIAEIQLKMQQCTDYASYCFLLAVECYAIASQYETDMKIDRLEGGDTDWTSEIENWESQGDNYMQQGNQYLQEKYQLQQELTKVNAEKAEKDLLKKNRIAALGSDRFAQKSIGMVNIGGSLYQGFFDAGFFNVTQQPKPFDDNYIPAGLTTITDAESGLVKTHSTQLPPNRFVFHEGGSSLLVGGFYPVTYIVGLGHCAVPGIEARRNGILIGVPPNYWNVLYQQFGTLRYTTIVMLQPLSSLTYNTTNASGGQVNQSQGWEDEIYITAIGEVPPVPTTIMKWFISTYTPYGWDDASFNAAAAYIDRYPMNFALFNRPNVLQLLTDLAFQSRCALWFNDGKFHLKFLAAAGTSVETITETDVDMNSLEVEYTSTEDLVTKLVATWRLTYDQEADNKIVFRNNIPRYGTVEETYDFFAYNLQACVQKMAEFWIIRKSNTFKRISFRTFLTKLKIETWDTITLNFGRNIVANGPVTAIVESAKFDTSSWKVVITAWVPVRAGEMTQFDYAFPANLPIEYRYPTPAATNREPTGITAGTLDSSGRVPSDAIATNGSSGAGRNQPIGDQYDDVGGDPNYDVQVALDSREVDAGQAPLFNPGLFNQYDIKAPSPLDALSGNEADGIFFGNIAKHLGENRYNVTIPDLAGGKDAVVSAIQFSIRSGEVIPDGTPAVVFRKTVRKIDANKLGGVSRGIQVKRVYYMQVPVWVKPKPEEGGGSSPPPPPPPGSPPTSEPGQDFGDGEPSEGDEEIIDADDQDDSGEDALGDGELDYGGGGDFGDEGGGGFGDLGGGGGSPDGPDLVG